MPVDDEPLVDPALYEYPPSPGAWVRANFVASVDGSIQDADGVSGSLGGEADLAAFTTMRRACDVVLVSAGTARAEGYGPSDDAVIALVSRSLDVPQPLRVPGVLVLAPGDAEPERVKDLESAGVEVLLSGTHEIDWPAALSALERRGLRRVLCEGGPTLFGTLAALDLVDELCLSIAPVLVGGDGLRISSAEQWFERPLQLAHAEAVDGVLLTRWTRAR